MNQSKTLNVKLKLAAAPVLIALLLVCAPHSGQAAEMPVEFADVLALDASAPDRVIAYGDHESQQGAVWLPRRKGPLPLIVLIHGGCWLEQYSAPHAYPLAAALARSGYAVWVPEYRRVGEDGGGWPGTPADVMRSLDVLTATNLPNVDRRRTVLMGHSAGGHLALWLASREPTMYPPGLQVVAAVGLAAITDLDSYGRGGSSCQEVVPVLMGVRPFEAPGLYREASPAALPMRVPVVLLGGGQDSIVGADQLVAMPEARSYSLEAAGHFDWIHPQTEAFAYLRRVLFELLSGAVSGSDKLQ